MNHYKTHNVCSREIHFNVENNIITHVEFVGGCSGNTQGVARLIRVWMWMRRSAAWTASTAAPGLLPARISWPGH